ncbi:MAG: hypothetical protein JO168_18130 [Solirubrobacterales bacterium]|nr:hypothetical protein [Solirubrobacterales bacterium]
MATDRDADVELETLKAVDGLDSASCCRRAASSPAQSGDLVVMALR